MKLPILIKSYSKDAEWLYWCLRSALRFARGFGDITVVRDRAPGDFEATGGAIRRALSDSAALFPDETTAPIVSSVPHTPEMGLIESGYIRQQAIKLHGDLIVNGDHLQLDSDCFFIRKTTPADFGDPPYWFRTPYTMLASDQAMAWRDATNAILGFRPEYAHHVALADRVPVEHEYMRRHPFLMRAEGLRGLRRYLEEIHSKSVVELFRGLSVVSEYNVYGAWCHRFRPDLYRWVDTSIVPPDKWPAPVVMQAWSYAGHGASGIPAETLARYRALLEE